MEYKHKYLKYKQKYLYLKNQIGGRIHEGDIIQDMTDNEYFVIIDIKLTEYGEFFYILDNNCSVRGRDIDNHLWKRIDYKKMFEYLEGKCYLITSYNRIEKSIHSQEILYENFRDCFINKYNYNIKQYVIFNIINQTIQLLLLNYLKILPFFNSLNVTLNDNKIIYNLPRNFILTIQPNSITLKKSNLNKYIILKSTIHDRPWMDTYNKYINLKIQYIVIDKYTNRINDSTLNGSHLTPFINENNLSADYRNAISITNVLFLYLQKIKPLFSVSNVKISDDPNCQLNNDFTQDCKLKFINLTEDFLENIYAVHIFTHFQRYSLENYMDITFNSDSVFIRILMASSGKLIIFELHYLIKEKRYIFKYKLLKRQIFQRLVESYREEIDLKIILDREQILENDDNFITSLYNISIHNDAKKNTLYPYLDKSITFKYNDRLFHIVGNGGIENPINITVDLHTFEAVSHMFLTLNNFINTNKKFFIIDTVIKFNIPVNYLISVQTTFINYYELYYLEEQKEAAKTSATATPSKKKEDPEEDRPEETKKELLDETDDVDLPAEIMKEENTLPYKEYFSKGLIKLIPEKIDEFIFKISQISNYNPNLKLIKDDKKIIIYLYNHQRINTVHLSLFFKELIDGRLHFTNELFTPDVSHYYFNFKFSDMNKDIFSFSKQHPDRRNKWINIEDIVNYYRKILQSGSQILNDRGKELMGRFGPDTIIEKLEASLNEIYIYINNFVKENYTLFGPTV